MPKFPAQRSTSGRTLPSAARLGSARSILRGELDKVGLPTLLTILEMERRSGILILQRPRQLGRLFVREGQVIRARVEGARRGSGQDAVFTMLGWPDGQFELWQAEVDGRDEIEQRTAFLIMEGLRRLDEARAGDHTTAGDIGEALAGI